MLRPHWLLGLALATGCGARTGLTEREAGVVAPECVRDQDCSNGVFCDGEEICNEGRCMPGAPVICTSPDACALSTCDEGARMCRTMPGPPDADGDGHRAPLPGHQPGDPGSCGDDCDDTDPAVHPGAREVCNGIDDNCNGLVDEGAVFTATDDGVRVSEPATAPSGPGGLAWTGGHYEASFWGYEDSKSHVYAASLDRNGTRIGNPPQRRLTAPPADAYGASVVWTGHEVGVTWQDRRDPAGGYEIYFNRLDPDGQTLGPDLRVTYAPGFSINPTVAWTGSEYVLAWQDEREAPGSGRFQVYLQRLDGEGRLILPNQRLTQIPANAESPVIAMGDQGLGLVWLDGRTSVDGAYFVTLSRALERMAPDQRVSSLAQRAVAPTLVWNHDRWLVAWHDDTDGGTDHQVWGATRNAGGLAITPPQRLTTSPSFARYPSLLPFGDRFLVTWADDRDGGQYKLFMRTVSPDLAPLAPETEVTHAQGVSVYPLMARGPAGQVGVLFRDQREGRIQTYFTHLSCTIP